MLPDVILPCTFRPIRTNLALLDAAIDQDYDTIPLKTYLKRCLRKYNKKSNLNKRKEVGKAVKRWRQKITGVNIGGASFSKINGVNRREEQEPLLNYTSWQSDNITHKEIGHSLSVCCSMSPSGEINSCFPLLYHFLK